MLSGTDNSTFGNVRGLCARDCYFGPFKFTSKIGTFLDLGANRGMVSLLALSCLGAERAIGVEALENYNGIVQLLLQANHLSPDCAPRYNRFVSSRSSEARDPAQNVSIETIRTEQGIDRFGFVKMDIEGGEIDVFRGPDWLVHVDNLAMEVHPSAGDLSIIPAALRDYSFDFVCVDQSGTRRKINDAMFVYASRNRSLRQL